MSADVIPSTPTGSSPAAASRMAPVERETQRYYADQYVGRAVSEVGITSGDKYYSWLRDQQLGVSRDTARTAWKEYGIATQWAPMINVFPGNFAIPKAWYGETDKKGTATYDYKTSIYLTYADTGDSFKSTYMVTSDTKLNALEISERITQDIAEKYSEQYSSVAGIEIVAVYHKAGAKW